MKKNLPNFIVAGVMKGSTSAAAVNLNKHDDVYCVTSYWKKKVNLNYGIDASTLSGGLSQPNTKELDFFNIPSNYNLGVDFYKQYFPLNKIARGEASPNYFETNETHYSGVTDRMNLNIPDLKIIIILRDPITRAFSHWNMIQSNKPSWGARFYGETFNDSTQQQPINNNILYRSKYLDNLNIYRNTFGEGNVYVTLQELIASNPIEEYNKMFTFLGVNILNEDPGYKLSHVSSYSSSIDSISETWLKSYFKEDVDAVQALYPDLDYSNWNTY